jgi:hypothetical protein
MALGLLTNSFDSNGRVVFVYGSTNLARRVCKIEGSDKCEEYVDLISDAFTLIWLLGAVVKSGAAGVSTATELLSSVSGALSKRQWDQNVDVPSEFISGLGDYNMTYTSLEMASLVRIGLKKRDDEPALISQIKIMNLKGESGRAHDVAINQYEDGTGQIHLPGYGQTLGNSTSSHLRKRFNGAGFKVAFTTRTTTQPTTAHKKTISKDIASNWAKEADAGIDDVIGFVKTNDKANFYWRIIPELKGFGTNYESVNICGGMASYLTD